MATINTNVFLEDAPRTAGEAFTINGGKLNIRTDTRVHPNAPASMTGTLGSITISASLGGGVNIDSSQVRLLYFNAGTGNVPPIGTTIAQGGVSGFLLGVWVDHTTAPSVVGSAMPTTGYLKFREVTGGSFTAGALTGIGATSLGADIAGWLEVVLDQAANLTLVRLGEFNINTNGVTWFDLGVTTGATGQIFQLPTNGGGAGTQGQGLWIETAPNSGEYDKYPAIPSSYFVPANLSTDSRSKLCETLSNGQLRIGNNGSVDVGFTPPAGCKVRVPNLFLRQAATTSRASNSTPHATISTRPEFVTTSAGSVNINGVSSDWYFLLSSAYSINIKDSALLDTLNISNTATMVALQNIQMGTSLGNSASLLAVSLQGGIATKDCKFVRLTAVASGFVVQIQALPDVISDNCEAIIVAYARNASSYAYYITQCRSITMERTKVIGQGIYINTTQSISLKDTDFCDRLMGSTNATTALSAISVANASSGVLIDGLTFGQKGLIGNCHPYNAAFYAVNSKDVKFRNLGTATQPVSGGTANLMAYIYEDAGGNTNVKLQRCYSTATRGNIFGGVNTSKGLIVENCTGTVGGTAIPQVNAEVRSIRQASVASAGLSSVYGTHFATMFVSDVQGRVWFMMNEPTLETSQYVSKVFGVGAGFTSNGQVSLPNIGDEVVIESSYFVKGFNGFFNVAPTITATNVANMSFLYDIDTGSGYSGTFKGLTGSNLSSESISSSVGFRMKLKITTITAHASNAVTSVQMVTTTSSAEQVNNVYPLDYTTITIKGAEVGSRVQLYDLTSDAELANGLATASGFTYSVPYASDFNLRVRVTFCNGLQAMRPIEFTESIGLSGLTRTITQESDTIYTGNLIDGSLVTGLSFNDSTLVISANTASITLQQIYAYEKSWLTTEQGIRDIFESIIAVDPVNYVIKSFKIKNIGSGELVISGGYVKSDVTDTAIGIVDTTGGTIFLAPDHVVGINVTGSDIEPSDIAEAVWDRLTINNQQSGTFGKLMQDISANVDDAIVTNFV